MASELLGLKSTSDLLVGVLGSRTVEDKLVQQFDLRKVYGYQPGGGRAQESWRLGPTFR